MWGEVLNIVASIGFVVSSGLYYMTDVQAPLIEQFATIFAVYWISEVSFAIFFLSSLMYYSAWRNARIQAKEKKQSDEETGYKLMESLHGDSRTSTTSDPARSRKLSPRCSLAPDSKWRDFNFLGEFFNVLPSAIYVISGLYVIFTAMGLLKYNFGSEDAIYTTDLLIESLYTVFDYTQVFYFIADLMFLLDSVFYFLAYFEYLDSVA
jgi:hypothetical protein